MKRKLIPAIIAALGMTAAGNASANIVGNINFGAIGTTSHLETQTVAETVINAPGDVLSGYGVFGSVNGSFSYCAVDANCRLFYTFTGYTVLPGLSPLQANFSGGTVNVYYDPGTGGVNTGFSRNLLNFTSPANTTYINGLTPWVQFTGHNNVVPGGCTVAGATLCGNGTVTGPSLSFTGQGLLDVAGGFGIAAVGAYFDNNNILGGAGSGFADVALGSEGNTLVRNPNDVCRATATGLTTGDYCIQGTASLRGTIRAVPEPESLGLLGIGLLGLVASLRRRKEKVVA